jgi:hypothetical protein
MNEAKIEPYEFKDLERVIEIWIRLTKFNSDLENYFELQKQLGG